jgi:hypothetical protein
MKKSASGQEAKGLNVFELMFFLFNLAVAAIAAVAVGKKLGAVAAAIAAALAFVAMIAFEMALGRLVGRRHRNRSTIRDEQKD